MRTILYVLYLNVQVRLEWHSFHLRLETKSSLDGFRAAAGHVNSWTRFSSKYLSNS